MVDMFVRVTVCDHSLYHNHFRKEMELTECFFWKGLLDMYCIKNSDENNLLPISEFTLGHAAYNRVKTVILL
jgi:hypothetical protein